MEELLRTNDLVLISFVESILTELDVIYVVADQAISALDGSIGILPRRILIDQEASLTARRVLKDAGLGAELFTAPKGFLPW